MRLKREHVFGLVVLALVAGALILGSVRRDTDPQSVEAAAEHALAKLDPRDAREALEQRCRPDAGVAEPITARACVALTEINGLDNQPLAAATRLTELSRARAGAPEANAALAEVQVLRIELLLTAGHSREAAREAQGWAEARREEKSIGAARLWLAAARAQRAIGDDEAAVEDAKQAATAARRAK